MTCKNKHRSTTVLEEVLLDLHHHIARLAWLIFFFNWDFTPCQAKQPLQGMGLQEKETQKD